MNRKYNIDAKRSIPLTLLSFAIASVLGSVIFSFFITWFFPSDVSGQFVQYFIVILIFSWSVALALGTPLLFYWRRRGWLNYAAHMLLGFIVGVLAGTIFNLLGDDDAMAICMWVGVIEASLFFGVEKILLHRQENNLLALKLKTHLTSVLP